MRRRYYRTLRLASAVILFLLIIVPVCGLLESKTAIQIKGEATMSNSRELLKNLSRGAWLQGTQFSYWDRGGPPGQGFESNYLELIGHGGRTPLIVYTKTRFDPAKPPYRVEKYEMPESSSNLPDFSTMADVGLFDHAFPEENSLPIGDVTKITVHLAAPGRSFEKTFYRDLPSSLVSIKKQFENLMKDCESKGKKSVVEQGS